MSIQNWFVRNEAVTNKAQGCLAYAHYLQDPKHPNHLNKTEIHILHNHPVKVALLAIEQAYDADLTTQRKGKGGRTISSFMQSYVFSLPDSIKLTQEEWRKVAKDISVELSAKLGISPSLLLKYSSFVLHEQSNSHLNVIICRNIEGKSFQQRLTRPSATNLLKRVFNASILKCGYSFDDYQPKRKPNRKQKRWEELREKEQYVLLKEVELKKIKHKINIANNQLAKLKLALEQDNQKDMNRQANRLQKSVESLVSTPFDDVYELQLQELKEEIEKLEPKQCKPVVTLKNKITPLKRK